MHNTIDITDVDLVEFVKKVYELSSPQGFGFFHAQPGGLLNKEAQTIVGTYTDESPNVLDMDYVHGRACKMHVHRKDGKLYITSPWYDHTNKQLQELLKHFNIPMPKETKHGTACNCVECRT